MSWPYDGSSSPYNWEEGNKVDHIIAQVAHRMNWPRKFGKEDLGHLGNKVDLWGVFFEVFFLIFRFNGVHKWNYGFKSSKKKNNQNTIC